MERHLARAHTLSQNKTQEEDEEDEDPFRSIINLGVFMKRRRRIPSTIRRPRRSRPRGVHITGPIAESKFFSVEEYGSIEAALQAAMEWRQAELNETPRGEDK